MIEKRQIYYWPNNAERTLHIYLPPGYYDSKERYPVMYFFDGHNLFHDDEATYGKSWGLEYFLDHWQKKMIIVGMECSHEGNERLSEYSPYDKRWQGHLVPQKGTETFSWLIHDIKPMIDHDYRTYFHREATGIGGSSMGGLMSVYGVTVHNDVFSKAACLSPGMFWNIGRLSRDLEYHFINPDTRVYFGWGEIEAGRAAHHGNPEYDTREARSIRKFERELMQRKASTYLYFQWGGRHCEADWEKQVGVFMNYLWF